MRKKVLAVALMLILLALPLAVRWFYFYKDGFEEREIPRPDLAAIEVPTPEMSPFVDRYTGPAPGTVLVDMAHRNRFEMSELNVLQARLSARGQQVELVKTTQSLAERLRYAKALIVVSPGKDFAPSEIRLLKTFVDKGGRLLLVTDPTRFDVRFDYYGNVLGLDSDVDSINGLAAQFGLVFQSDYLYNTVENEGNFRNIKLTDLAENALTEKLDQVVFYATHSIVSEELALISADGETRTSGSERAEELAVAVLAADEAVLALGDLTFMVEPHNAVYDNDQLVANIADFLSGAQRRYELADFPFFFGNQVDLVYAGAPLLDSDLLMGGGGLQAYFLDKGKELTFREMEDEAQDTLFLGLYDYTEEVDPYLAAAGVTLLITPTETLEGELEPGATPAIAPALPLTGTLIVTSTAEITVTTVLSPAAVSRVEIASLGQMVVTGTALLVLQPDGDRHVLLVLANTEAGLESTVERLTEGDLEGCLLREAEDFAFTTLALCSTGEVVAGEGGGGWQKSGSGAAPVVTPTPTPSSTSPITGTVEPAEPEGHIIVVAFDDGEGRYDSMTSADDYADILGERFDVTVWSKAQDGPPDAVDFTDYDLVIWTTGDFENAISEEESDLLFPIVLGGKPIILSGAYLDDATTTAVQRDIQAKDASHPVAQGFEPGEVISFVSPPSGGEYEIGVVEGDMTEESVVVFVRGPDSESAGASSIVVAEEELTGLRIALIGFPLYLLPQEAKTRLVLNVVDWMLTSAE
jgi:hypothetical protein